MARGKMKRPSKSEVEQAFCTLFKVLRHAEVKFNDNYTPGDGEVDLIGKVAKKLGFAMISDAEQL